MRSHCQFSLKSVCKGTTSIVKTVELQYTVHMFYIYIFVAAPSEEVQESWGLAHDAVPDCCGGEVAELEGKDLDFPAHPCSHPHPWS